MTHLRPPKKPTTSPAGSPEVRRQWCTIENEKVEENQVDGGKWQQRRILLKMKIKPLNREEKHLRRKITPLGRERPGIR